MELRKRNLGFALGMTWGLAVMLGTWWLMYMGSPGDTISKLGGFYFGYTLQFCWRHSRFHLGLHRWIYLWSIDSVVL